jgi:hypothetical protein
MGAESQRYRAPVMGTGKRRRRTVGSAESGDGERVPGMSREGDKGQGVVRLESTEWGKDKGRAGRHGLQGTVTVSQDPPASSSQGFPARANGCGLYDERAWMGSYRERALCQDHVNGCVSA